MLNILLYKLGQFLSLNLPINFSYSIASFVAILRYFFCRADRNAVVKNLRVIFPNEDIRILRQYAKEVFINFGKYLVDFFRFSKIDEQYLKKYVTIEGKENLDNALSKNKGVITVTAHIGNWELGGIVMAIMGYPIIVVALPHKEKSVNEFFNEQRKIKGMKVIQLGRAARHCLEALHNNEVLGLVGDRDFSPGDTRIDFFNRPAMIPRGPAVLSIKTGAIIVPGFMVREKNDHFRLIFQRPIESLRSDDPQYERDLIRKYLSIIESFIRKYPDQWYMFRPLWVEDLK